MITLKEISQLTGVSISTVSRVMSGKGRISEATRKRVMGAVQELLLQPGLIAQSAQISIHDIGIITPDAGEFFHDDPSTSLDLRSLQTEIKNTGNKPHIIELSQFRGKKPEDFRKTGGQNLDGFILFDPPADFKKIQPIVQSGMPYIVTNGHYLYEDQNFVDTDNFAIGCRMVDYLYRMGHTDFIILSGPLDRMTSRNRLEGVKKGMTDCGLSFSMEKVCEGEFSLESGYTRMRDILEKNGHSSAVIAFSDFIALGAMRACKEKGLKIPEEVSVIGIDNIDFSHYSDPPLTTFDRRSANAAVIVARDIQHLVLYGDIIGKINVHLKTEFIERESCAAPGKSAG